jgi:hypothetical protein
LGLGLGLKSNCPGSIFHGTIFHIYTFIFTYFFVDASVGVKNVDDQGTVYEFLGHPPLILFDNLQIHDEEDQEVKSVYNVG